MIVDHLPRSRRMGALLALCVDLALWAAIVGLTDLGVALAPTLPRLFGA